MAEANNPPPFDDADPIDEVDGQQPPAPHQNQGRVNTIQLKLPPFWKADPDLWFLQIEAQFATAGVRADLSKYNHLVGQLDTNTLSKVKDIIKNPPAANKYLALKDRLTHSFTESDRKKLKTLFSDLSLNDEQPSDLLRQMKNKSCDKVSDELLQELWINRLPQQIQAILSYSTEPLDQQVIIADKIYDTIDQNAIQAFSQQQQQQQLLDNDFQKKFCKLEDMIASLQRDINKSRSRNSSPWRNRSQSRSTSRPKQKPSTWCWYHQQFKDKATKCDSKMNPPCTFKNYKPKNNQKN